MRFRSMKWSEYLFKRTVMMGTKLNWVEGPLPGKLAFAVRPRGGEWLADEIANWRWPASIRSFLCLRRRP